MDTNYALEARDQSFMVTDPREPFSAVGASKPSVNER